MSNLYQRSYSPYSQDKPQQSQLPLRSKAFSHLDNISRNSSQYQDYNVQVNDDKINGIKKKYEKVIASKSKANQQNTRTPYDFTKSVSILDSYDENNTQSPYRKSCQTPTALYQKKQDQRNVLKHFPTRSYGGRQTLPQKEYSHGRNQMKSQLESNRLTLNAMKNQLQSKLNDLTMKTNKPQVSSNNNPKNINYQASSPFQKEDSEAYQAILNKYTKHNEQKDDRYSKYTVDYTNSFKKANLQTRNQQIPINSASYLPKNSMNKPQTISEQPKQLSTITQNSNSNNSDFHKQSSYQLEERGHRLKALQHNRAQIGFKSTIQPSKYYLNGNKYEGSRYANAPYIENKETNKSNMEFTLNKVQNKPSYSPIRKPQTPVTPNKTSKYTYQKRIDPKESYSNNNYQHQHHHQQSNFEEISFAHPQKQSFLDKSQIEQLKDKYNVTNNSYPMHKDKSCNKGEAKDNEKISREIQKLDLKIKQIQQNKKDLNINFKPYDPSSSKSISKNNGSSQFKYEKSTQYRNESSFEFKHHQISTQLKGKLTNYGEKDKILPISNNNQPNFDKNKYSLRPQVFQRSRPSYNNNQTISYQPSKTYSTAFGIKMVSSNNNEDPLSQRSVSDSSFKNKVNNYMKPEQTKAESQYRKKTNQQEAQNNNNIKALVKAFGQQAVLDENLRNNKIWFVSQNKPRKWDQLKKQLQAIGVNLVESKLKQMFALDDSENNPFFSVTQSKCTIKSLAQSYQQSQKYWEQKIVYKFSRAQLERQGFDSNKIDCEKKGFIEVEDLVRFLNIESGTFFRNRDVSVIFKRMNSKGNKIQFIDLINLVSK